jgi:hypothetical protein
MNGYNFDEIRLRNPLPEYCQAAGIQLKKHGSYYLGLCPAHDDREESFSVYFERKSNCHKYKCHACDFGGDVIDLDMHLRGGDRKDACERLGGYRLNGDHGTTTAIVTPIIPAAPMSEAPKQEAYTQSTTDLQECVQASSRLIERPESLADWRSWRRETVLGLAMDGDLGLDDSDNPAFLYDTGFKARTRETGGAKKVWWNFGTASLWRASHITKATERVVITEGEPDAITLIDAGIESDGKTVVVALPSASYRLDTDLERLRGKRIILVGDCDDKPLSGNPGIKSLRKKTSLLAEAAAEIWWVDITFPGAKVHVKDITDLRDALGGLSLEEFNSRLFRVDDIGARFEAWAESCFPGIKAEIEAETEAVKLSEAMDFLSEPVIKLNELPDLVLPTDDTKYRECAETLYKILAKTNKYFVRDRKLVQLVKKETGYSLAEVSAEKLVTELEYHFNLFKWRKLNGVSVLKPSRCSREIADMLLESREMDLLPSIKIVTSAPIFVEADGKIQALKKGYHSVSGGVYVLKDRDIKALPLDEAKESLLELLRDFKFTAPADKSRALASLLSPALRFGGLLGNADFPMDVAEADQSQSGKTYRQKIVCALYGETAFILTLKEKDGGVGSLDEAVSEAILSGKPFLMLENVRGKVASQLLESAIRGHGLVNARQAYSRGIQAATDRILWLLTSNAAESTIDLANRSIITRVKKQPKGYAFKEYSEGDLLDHIKANTDRYLSCVYTVLCEWYAAGKPRSRVYDHDFREWTQTLDWIVTKVFGLAPLLEGHQDEQKRISNPDIGWLRKVALAVEKDDCLDEGLKSHEIVAICEDYALDIPGTRPGMQPDQVLMTTGKTLGRIFRENPTIETGGFEVSRKTEKEYNESQRRQLPTHYYWFKAEGSNNVPKPRKEDANQPDF